MKKSNSDVHFVFVPHLDFIDSGRFQFPENEYNISPLSKRLPVRIKLKFTVLLEYKKCDKHFSKLNCFSM